MTTPTVLSDVATYTYQIKHKAQGNMSQKATATVAASTASGTNIGMIRFQKGFSLINFAIKTDDLDTSTNVTFDVGYVYDDNTTYTNDTDAFLNDSAIPQSAGSYVWPVASALLAGVGFTAEAPGYIVIQTGGGSTTTAGSVTMIASFTYDM